MATSFSRVACLSRLTPHASRLCRASRLPVARLASVSVAGPPPPSGDRSAHSADSLILRTSPETHMHQHEALNARRPSHCEDGRPGSYECCANVSCTHASGVPRCDPERHTAVNLKGGPRSAAALSSCRRRTSALTLLRAAPLLVLVCAAQPLRATVSLAAHAVGDTGVLVAARLETLQAGCGSGSLDVRLSSGTNRTGGLRRSCQAGRWRARLGKRCATALKVSASVRKSSRSEARLARKRGHCRN